MTGIPKRIEQNEALSKERIYRTALTCRDYLRLELEASERGTKPYSLVQNIVTMYLDEKLITVEDLPENIKKQVNQYFSELAASRSLVIPKA